MSTRLFGFGAGLALLAGVASQASAQVAQGSTFDLSVKAEADMSAPGPATATWSDSQGATLNPYSHSLQVTDLNALGGGPLTVKTSASASWANAGQGSVSIFDTGWNWNTSANSFAEINTITTGLDFWTYTFLATADGTFDMNYNIVGSGDTFGLVGANIHWSGPGGALILTNIADPTANGTFSRSIVAGQSYTVGIGTYSNRLNTGGGVTTAGSFDGQFDWKINAAPVPEPFSVAGLALGVTALLRKRKKA